MENESWMVKSKTNFDHKIKLFISFTFAFRCLQCSKRLLGLDGYVMEGPRLKMRMKNFLIGT